MVFSQVIQEAWRVSLEQEQRGVIGLVSFLMTYVRNIWLTRKVWWRDAVSQSIVENSGASLKPSLSSLVQAFIAGPNKSVSEAFRAGYIGSKVHTDAAIGGIKLRFLEGTASDDGDGFTTSENVVHIPAHPQATELLLVFSFTSQIDPLSFLFL